MATAICRNHRDLGPLAKKRTWEHKSLVSIQEKRAEEMLTNSRKESRADP